MVIQYRAQRDVSRREISGGKAIGVLGYGHVYEISLSLFPDEPDAFLAAGIQEAGHQGEPDGAEPGFHLENGGAAGREYDDGLLSGDPAGLDPGEAFLTGIGKNAEVNPALGKARTVSAHGLFQPISGGGVVVLGKDFPGSGKA